MIKLTQNGSVADASSAMVSAQLVDADWSTFAGPHGKRRRDLSMNVRYVYKRLECGLYWRNGGVYAGATFRDRLVN